MKSVLVVFAMLVLIVVLYGLYRMQTSGDLSVRFILPDGYRGIFRLVVDPHAGQPTQEKGVWVYRIPETGLLGVKERWPFSEWHSTAAFYSGGKSLAVAPSPPGEPYSDEVRLHSAGSWSHPNGSQTIEFFVGTDREMLKISKLTNRPLGGVAQ
jgi:hypothetical protein